MRFKARSGVLRHDYCTSQCWVALCEEIEPQPIRTSAQGLNLATISAGHCEGGEDDFQVVGLARCWEGAPLARPAAVLAGPPRAPGPHRGRRPHRLAGESPPIPGPSAGGAGLG